MRSCLSRAAVARGLGSSPAAAQAPQPPPATPGSPPATPGPPPATPSSPPATPSSPEEPVQLPPVQVIGTTPLPSLGVPLDKYPGNAQRVTSEEIRQGNQVNLTDQPFRNFRSGT